MLSVLPSCPVHSQWLNSGMVCRDCGRYLICLFVIRCCFHCNNGHWIWVVECLIRFRPFRISLADRRANHPGPFGTEAAPSNNFFFLLFFLSCEHRHRLRNGHLYRWRTRPQRSHLLVIFYALVLGSFHSLFVFEINLVRPTARLRLLTKGRTNSRHSSSI